MNSSTSSSSLNPLLKLALIVLALFIVLEVITRTVLFPMSLDFGRFASYRERADALQSQAGLRVAFIGNSATEAGVDVDVLKDTLSTNDVLVPSVELFLADGSGINTWSSMMNHYFWKRGNAPDLIVITFFGPSLDDGREFEVGRLAQFFTDLEDWPELFQFNLVTTSQRVEWVLASVWATYAARDRIKDRVLSLFVPNYKEYAIVLHDEGNRDALRKGAPRTSVMKSHRLLQSVLQRARKLGSRLLFVAYPMRDTQYTVHPDALRLIRDFGADYLDMRALIDLEPTLYRDTYHLTVTGKPIYTKRFAEVLAPMLRTLGRSGRLAYTATGATPVSGHVTLPSSRKSPRNL
jgi:hypothetical protein